MRRTEEDKAQPWISNYPPLAEWLKANNAVCIWCGCDCCGSNLGGEFHRFVVLKEVR
jgi:hypothetical protein